MVTAADSESAPRDTSGTAALDALLTPAEAAEYLKTTPGVLAQDRHKGTGIPYTRVGRRILYRARDIAAYLDANTVPTGGGGTR